MTFDEMQRRAEHLPLSDLRRHASISTNNDHRCRECFTCACEAVLRRMEDERTWERKQARLQLGR